MAYGLFFAMHITIENIIPEVKMAKKKRPSLSLVRLQTDVAKTYIEFYLFCLEVLKVISIYFFFSSENDKTERQWHS